MPFAGNERCEEENSNAECGYDGGDCCKYTCMPTNFFCESNFDCLDPNAIDDERCSQVQQCSANTPQEFVLRSTSDIATSAALGGVFSVVWIGNIIVNETIWVTDLTTLSIAGGVGNSTGIADGNHSTKIIAVVNATLHHKNMHLIHGSQMTGGVMSIDYGNVTLSGEIAFINNMSISHAAVRVDNGGNLTLDDVWPLSTTRENGVPER